MTIWRYHDHMHAAAGDRIYWGVADKLGWNQYLVPGQKAPWLYEIPQTTLVDLAADLKRKLDMTTLLTSCWGSPVISWSQVGAIRVSPVESVRTRSITS